MCVLVCVRARVCESVDVWCACVRMAVCHPQWGTERGTDTVRVGSEGVVRWPLRLRRAGAPSPGWPLRR